MQKKIIAAIVIAIAVSGIVFGSLIYLQKKSTVPGSNIITQTQKKVTTATEPKVSEENKVETKPTGNAAGITQQITAQLQTEEEKFSAEDTEAKSSNISQEDFNNFGESYDENEF